MKSKYWIIGFFICVLTPLIMVASWVAKVDPFFHYHKPDTSKYYYSLYNQRSQNDGITRNFDYDGLLTGSSMTVNFKTSDAEDIFGGKFIKVSYFGASYKEINDNLKVGLTHNPNLKTIIRGLDMYKFASPKDIMAVELGDYPMYLYNNNPFDDVKYLFNRDVVFDTVYNMELNNDKEDFSPGIDSFDYYSNCMAEYVLGINSPDLFLNGIPGTDRSVVQQPLTDEEKANLRENVKQNITSLAEEYPDVDFYYFLTPYSAAWWQTMINVGSFEKQIEAEKMVIEEVLKVNNIKLYSFNNVTEITTDLNNYKDTAHYGEWINTLMLRYMKDEKYLLTQENYKEYLQTEKDLYWNLDYDACFNNQKDYEQDYYSAALFNEEIYNVKPYPISKEIIDKSEMQNATIVDNQHDESFGIVCKGSLSRPTDSELSVPDYIIQNDEYCGLKVNIDDISDYKYLAFYGKKNSDHGQPSVYIYNEDGVAVKNYTESFADMDGEWHQYLMDISSIEGKVEIVFNGGYIDSAGSEDSEFIFSDIALY